jgi:6-pyruvoyltetrahydropterin/6-carboxytetrahydropterin synthase
MTPTPTQPQFEITVETEFCAAHALTVSGVVEPRHGHNFRVRAVVGGNSLDSDGLLCDFHTVGEILREIIEPFSNQDLNEIPPFDDVNPSAENLAQHIADKLAEELDESLAPHARVVSVQVSEATGCWATYRRPA